MQTLLLQRRLAKVLRDQPGHTTRSYCLEMYGKSQMNLKKMY